MFWHQYMTNCLAPYSESSGIYKAYSSNGMLSSSIGFIIPVYENMPKYSTESPNILEQDYVADNKKMYADVSGKLNVRCGPSTSYEVLTSIDRNTVFTRIKRGIQSGERWDKIELENGMVGYVFQNYLKEIPEVKITSIKLTIDNNVINKGSSNNINIQIQPENAKGEIVWSSSNNDILTVDNGHITGISSGVATITAKTLDGKVKDEINITVYSKVTDIVLSKEELVLFVGDSATIKANIFPEDASDKTIKWSSSNLNIASVNAEGVVKANEEGIAEIVAKDKEGVIESKCKVIVKKLEEGIILEIDKSLRIEADEISKLDINKLEVGNIKKLINTNLNMEIYNNENKLLEDTDLIGTNSKLVLKDKDGKEVYRYVFIIYGDLNGDGLINSLDVLVLQKHILEIKQLSGVFLKSGNISKNGEMPSSLDVLKIQKHILETKFIEQ